jgi:hypothetical protein
MMRFLRAGGDRISVIRVGMLIGVIGVTVFLILGISFYMDQASRHRPYYIPPPEGAVEYGSIPMGSAQQHVFYRIPMAQMSIEEVVAHYTERLQALEGTDEVECERFPSAGNFSNYVPGTETVPYEFKCLFNRSGFNTVQTTEVLVQPGVEVTDTESLVLIRYDQRWTR